jgi:hypothetical protein
MPSLVRTLSVTLLSVVLLALPACGGGGGGATGGVVLPGDLAIISTNPAVGAVDVDPATAVEIVFGADLDQATLPAQALVLRIGAGTVTGQVAYDAARRALVFTPLNPLAYATDYDVLVDEAIEDVDGNRLASPFTYSFRTADAVQAFEQPHEFAVDPATAAAVVTNDDGVGLSAYVIEKPLSWELVVRSYDKANGFGAPVTLYDGPTRVSLHATDAIAVNGNGEAIIGYKVDGAGSDVAMARTFDAISGTLTSVRILSTAGADARQPQVAIDEVGHAVVLWTQKQGTGDIQLYGSIHDYFTGWTPSGRLEPTAGDVVDVEIDMGRNGHLLAAWKLVVGDDRAARARPWKNGSFGVVHTVHYLLNTRAEIVDVQVLGSGESIVVYTLANTPAPTQFSLKAKRYRPATLGNPGWQTAEYIDDVGGGFLRAVTAQDDGNRLTVAWGVDSPDGVTRLRYRRYIPGPIGWDAPVSLTNLPLGSFQDGNLRVVSRDGRRALFTWSYDNGGPFDERRATLVVDGVPSYKDLLLPGRGGFGAATGMDGNGNSVLIDYIDANLDGFNLVTVDAFGNVAGPTRIDSAAGGFIPTRYLAVDADGGLVLLFTRVDGVRSVFHLVR